MEKEIIRVHMLPTEKITNIDVCKKQMSNRNIGDMEYFSSSMFMSLEYWKPQQLYFTSDEDIKKGDWMIKKNNHGTFVIVAKSNSDSKSNTSINRKILFTTDTELTKLLVKNTNLGRSAKLDKKSLPQPSQSFVEKFCDVGGIWNVLVEYEPIYLSILKEKMLGYKLKVNFNNEITIHPIKTSWGREEHLKDIKDFGREILQICNNVNKEQNPKQVSLNKKSGEKLLDDLFKKWVGENTQM